MNRIQATNKQPESTLKFWKRLLSVCQLMLSFLRVAIATALLLRLHFVILLVFWFVINTSQVRSLQQQIPVGAWCLATIAFYIVILSTAFRIMAFAQKLNALSFALIVGAATWFLSSIPGCWEESIYTVAIGLGLSFGYTAWLAIRSSFFKSEARRKSTHLAVFLSEFRQILVTRWRVVKRAANYPESWLLSALLYVVLPVLGFYALARNGGHVNVPYVLVLLAALWLLVLTEIQRWSLRIALPIATSLVIWSVILSAAGWNYQHQIRTLAPIQGSETPGEITNVFSKWLNSRNDQLLYRHRPYPVILVAAEGGGIRAAFITAEFLNLLRLRDNSFPTHLFAISGVSAGSVGGTIFAAGCKAAQKNGAIVADMPRRVLSERNFLSGPLAALLGPEIFQKLLPMHAPLLSHPSSLEKICIDRASALELVFEDAF